jgi:predicted histone-like DNA-binding protein
MSLLYKARQSNLETKDGKKKWYPYLMKIGKAMSTQELGELIAEKSSLSPGDVHNVIRTMMTTIRHEMLNNRSVQLDGLGIFTLYVHAKGNGVDTCDEVNYRQINRLSVHFSPTSSRNANGTLTRAMYDDVSYERYKEQASAPVVPSDVSLTGVTLNGASIAQGSGSLSIASGDALVLSGTGLTVSGIKTEILTDPFGSPEVIALSGIGSVTADAPGTSLTVNVTVSGAVFSLLKAGDDTVLFSFE